MLQKNCVALSGKATSNFDAPASDVAASMRSQEQNNFCNF